MIRRFLVEHTVPIQDEMPDIRGQRRRRCHQR
jgi:hypothetical protein